MEATFAPQRLSAWRPPATLGTPGAGLVEQRVLVNGAMAVLLVNGAETVLLVNGAVTILTAYNKRYYTKPEFNSIFYLYLR